MSVMPPGDAFERTVIWRREVRRERAAAQRGH